MLGGEQIQHLSREKERLANRVKELEQNAEVLLENNARLTQELAAATSSAQQLSFHNETLLAQSQLSASGGDQMSRFAADYSKLQAQFREVVDQKNQLQEEMNRAHHSLQQREARCQQLAMQVCVGVGRGLALQVCVRMEGQGRGGCPVGVCVWQGRWGCPVGVCVCVWQGRGVAL